MIVVSSRGSTGLPAQARRRSLRLSGAPADHGTDAPDSGLPGDLVALGLDAVHEDLSALVGVVRPGEEILPDPALDEPEIRLGLSLGLAIAGQDVEQNPRRLRL